MQNISPHDEGTRLPFKLIQYLTNKHTCLRMTNKGILLNENELQALQLPSSGFQTLTRCRTCETAQSQGCLYSLQQPGNRMTMYTLILQELDILFI